MPKLSKESGNLSMMGMKLVSELELNTIRAELEAKNAYIKMLSTHEGLTEVKRELASLKAENAKLRHGFFGMKKWLEDAKAGTQSDDIRRVCKAALDQWERYGIE